MRGSVEYMILWYYHFSIDYNYKDNEDEPVSDSEIDVFSKAAMNNAYYISHNIQVREEKNFFLK